MKVYFYCTMEATEEPPIRESAPDQWASQEHIVVADRESYDSESSNTFEDERAMSKIKPEVELKEETDGFVYKPDTRGHLKLVISDPSIPNTNSELHQLTVVENPASSHFSREPPTELNNDFAQDDVAPQFRHIRHLPEVGMPAETVIDSSRIPNSFPPVGPHAAMTYIGEQKFVNESFQVPYNGYTDLPHQKIFSVDEPSSLQARCCMQLTEGCCENKVNYQVQINGPFCGSKHLVNQAREGTENNIWSYNMNQSVRISNTMTNVSSSELKETCESLVTTGNRTNSNAELWQLYQDLLAQKKMEEKFAQNDDQRREKMKEIGRIRARLYRAKLRQNGDVWQRHKAMRAQKQREERLKLTEEQKEKIKALARVRAKKHREKLKENELAWKKYKEMRASKQRLERLKAKEQIKDEAERQEFIQLAEQSEKMKELARERAKKHRERLKGNSDAWVHYKEVRAQKKREERLMMANDQRERLKHLARIRARKYREKLKGNDEEWKRYKEMRARKQREERMKLNEDQKERAKELARVRAKLYREKKRIGTQIPNKSENVDSACAAQNWFDCGHSDCSNNCSVYFYHAFLQNAPKATSTQ